MPVLHGTWGGPIHRPFRNWEISFLCAGELEIFKKLENPCIYKRESYEFSIVK